jgi:hypothetical protein
VLAVISSITIRNLILFRKGVGSEVVNQHRNVMLCLNHYSCTWLRVIHSGSPRVGLMCCTGIGDGCSCMTWRCRSLKGVEVWRVLRWGVSVVITVVTMERAVWVCCKRGSGSREMWTHSGMVTVPPSRSAMITSNCRTHTDGSVSAISLIDLVRDHCTAYCTWC